MTTDNMTTGSKPMQRWIIPALWYGGFWLLLTLWLRFALPESIMGWERHQLFRFSADYLTFFSPKPYPVLLYLQAFFTQFYIFPWLGAAVIGGLLTLGMGAWPRLTGRLWPGAVWVALLLPTIPYFNLLWILVWLVLLGGGVLVNLRRLSKGGRLGLIAGLSLAAVFILQENAVFAVGFWTVIYGMRTRSWRSAGIGLAAGLTGTIIGLFFLNCEYPLFYPNHMKRWSLLMAKIDLFYIFPAIYFTYPNLLRIGLYIGLGILLPLPLIGLRPAIQWKLRPAWQHGLYSASLTFLLVITGYGNLHYQMEDFYLTDRLASENHWVQALVVANRAFFERARPDIIGKTLPFKKQTASTLPRNIHLNHPFKVNNPLEEAFLTDNIKICLLANRWATSSLFAYNGSFYFPLLFPEHILYSPSSYLMTLYYTDNGFYAEALHLLYDFVTSQRISTAVLEPLLWNSIVVGDYAPCRKFIRLFEQSLFHKDIARRYTAYIADTVALASRPEIATARLYLSLYNHKVLGYEPDNNIHFRLQHESDNAAIYEYALALWMVYKNHAQILEELPKIRQYYPVLPRHIQEAILANFPPERLDEAPADIDPDIKSRYIAYLQMHSLYQNGYTAFKKLKRNFADTYWYHLHFNEFKPIEPEKDGPGNRI